MREQAQAPPPVRTPAQAVAPFAGRMRGRSWFGSDWPKWLFILPAVIWIVALSVYPMFNAIRSSLYSYRYGKVNEFVGLDNFERLLRDEALRQDLRTTLVFVASTVSIQMVLGFGLALFFNREIRGRAVLRTIMSLPIFATPVAIGYLAITLYYESGPVNSLVEALGGTGVPWLADPQWAQVAIIIVDVWQWTPFVFLIALAGLQGLPQDLLEASEVDGSNRIQVFRWIILPLMAPILWLIVLLRMIDAFKVFDAAFAMTQGGPGRATEYFSLFTYRTYRRFSDYGYAAAQGFLLLLIVMVLVSLLWGRIRHIYETE
jgi:multiple sugar transport system permease protein